MLLRYILYCVSVLLLLSILSLLIRNTALFYVATIAVFGTNLWLMNRFIGVFVYIILLVLTARKYIRFSRGIFFLSFIALCNFYYSAEFGFFLLAAHAVFCLGSIVSAQQEEKKQRINAVLFFSGAGFLLGVLFGVYAFGVRGFGEFVRITFLVIPRVKPYMDEYVYPPFPEPSQILSSLHWMPIILTTALVWFILYEFSFHKMWKNAEFILVAVLTALSVVTFRVALGRSDEPHINFVLPFLFLALLSAADYLWERSDAWYKRLGAVLWVIPLFLTPFFSLATAVAIPHYSPETLWLFAAMPKRIPDEAYLTENQNAVVSYIRTNTTKNDYVFVFTNESAFYYFLERRSPTRFYTIWFAQPDFYQKEAVADLVKKQPKYVIISSDCWCNVIDRVPNSARVPEIYSWLEKRYEEDTRIGDTVIWKQRPHAE